MGNLLDSASIVLTPTAYDNGKMLSVKPSVVLGPELITNGDFVTNLDGWILSPSTPPIWDNGMMKMTSDGVTFSRADQTFVTEIGAEYEFKINKLVNNNNILIKIGDGIGNSNVLNQTLSSIDEYTFTIIAISTTTYIRIEDGSGSVGAYISNISVKEDLNGDFDFSRNSAATRVNAQGLVENVQILSGDLVSNGDFSQIGTEEVSNGSFSQIGPEEVSNGSFSQEGVEEVTNGDFATDTDWIKGTGWTIGSGKANSINTVGFELSQPTAYVAGKTYKVTYTISDYVSGSIRVYYGGTTAGTLRNSNGTYTEYIAASGSQNLFFRSVTSFTGSIDNVSVKEVGQDWTLQDGWSIGDDKAVSDGTINQSLIQTNVFTIGKSYKINFTISDVVGSLDARIWMATGGAKIEANANGNYTTYWEADGTNLYTTTLGTNTATYSVTNISVQEVGQDWNFNNGAAIAEDKATIIGDGSVFGYVEQVSTFVSGKTYKVTLDAIINSGGGLNVKYGIAFSENIGSITTSGSYTFYYTASISGSIIIGRSTGGVAYDSSVTNISVKEVGQDWNVENPDGDNYVEFVDGTARLKFLNTSPITQLTSSTGIYQPGKKYKLIVDIADATSGSIKIDAAGISETFATAGISTRIINPTGNSALSFYRATPNVDITLNSVSLIEITDDTNLPRINYEGFSYQDVLGSEEVVNGDFSNGSANWNFTNVGGSNGWRISNSKAICDTIGVANGRNLNSSTSLVSGKSYKVTLDILQSEDEIGILVGSTFIQDAFPIGTNLGASYIINSSQHSGGTFSLYAGSSDLQEIDNVSVKEYFGQEVVPDSGCGSWLLEPQSTNLLTYSEDFSQWGNARTIDTANATISPEGTNNATLVEQESGQTSSGSIYLANLGSLSGTYTQSVYAKKQNKNYIVIYDANAARTYFNLENGTIGTIASGNTAKIEDIGNGWYRCSTTYPTSGSVIAFYLADNNNSTAVTDNGGVYIWGAMFEQQSYSTSYIPTNGAASTRLQDIANNSGNATLINSTEGVLYTQISALDATGDKWIALSDGTTSERISIALSNNDARAYVRNTAGLIWDFSTPITDMLEPNKIALRYKAGDYAMFLDGIKMSSSSDTSVASGISTLAFDSGAGASKFFGKNKALGVWKEALTDEQLYCLTYPAAVTPTFDLNFSTIADDFTFTRGSEATFVNSQGLIQSTNEIGPELVVNGDFATDTDWDKDPSWSIANGKASYNGVGNGHRIKQNIPLTIGKKYKASLDILDSTGNFRISVDGGSPSYVNYTTGNGTYTFEFISTSVEFSIRASMGYGSDTISIDNVSVKEVISATNTPRLDYSTGSEAFLLEPQSTNLLTQSEDFSDSYWNKIGASITSNAVISPDGGLNADKLVEDTSTGTHRVTRSTITVSNNSTISNSIFVKKGGRDFVRLSSYDGITGFFAYFDLNNGIIGTVGANTTATITDMTDGWYKCTTTFTIAGTNLLYELYSCEIDNSISYTGDGTSGIYIWGAMVEQQSYATSYIPTSGAIATRNQELCVDATPVINSKEGVLYAEIAGISDGNVKRYISLSDGSTANDVRLYLDTNGYISALTKVGGSTQAFLSTNAYVQNDFNKIAFKYKENDFALWVNGTEVSIDNSGLVNASNTLNQLNFNGNNLDFHGNTKDVQVYTKALKDIQLIALTSWSSFTEMANALNYTIK